MELIPTTDQQLRTLAEDDEDLSPYFAGVFPSDKLPKHPVKDKLQGYIVNIDESSQPGSHWIGIWTQDNDWGENHCTVMDSFGIPLSRYQAFALESWLAKHWTKENITMNTHSFQAIDSQTCGAYALMFIMHCSLGGNLKSFQDIFSTKDFVTNDHRLGIWFRKVIRRDLKWHEIRHRFKQSNHVPVRLMDMMMLLDQNENYDTVY